MKKMYQILFAAAIMLTAVFSASGQSYPYDIRIEKGQPKDEFHVMLSDTAVSKFRFSKFRSVHIDSLITLIAPEVSAGGFTISDVRTEISDSIATVPTIEEVRSEISDSIATVSGLPYLYAALLISQGSDSSVNLTVLSNSLGETITAQWGGSVININCPGCFPSGLTYTTPFTGQQHDQSNSVFVFADDGTYEGKWRAKRDGDDIIEFYIKDSAGDPSSLEDLIGQSEILIEIKVFPTP